MIEFGMGKLREQLETDTSNITDDKLKMLVVISLPTKKRFEIVRRRSLGVTLDQLGSEMNLTKEGVRQLHIKSLRKIRTTIKEYYSVLEILNNIGKPKQIEEKANQYSKIEIANTDLSTRSRNFLIRANIKTLADLRFWRYRDLSRLQNAGKKSIREIEELAKSYGISLRNNNIERHDRLFVEKTKNKALGDLVMKDE